MKFITAQPDRKKFYWQLLVQLANFKDMGIDLNDVHVLVGNDVGQSKEMQSLRDTGAQVFLYPYAKDYRYISSVRPHILKQHFARYPKLRDEYIFYCDCDVIFRRLPDFSKMPQNGNWYISDTRNYIGAENYILRAGGPQILIDMCAAVGIDPFYVKMREAEAGGCQYFLTGVDAAFWEKVERDCIELYVNHPLWSNNEQKYKGANLERYAALHEKPIQLWCADMWAVLWNAWLKRPGYETVISDELTFSWGHHDLNSYNSRVMLHMSGVSKTTQKNQYAPHFDKLKYSHELPFNDDFSWVNPNSASTKYVEYFKRFRGGFKSN